MRRWMPDDPLCVAEELFIDIGPKTKQAADTFRVRLATPRGLEQLDDRDGIIAVNPLVVMRKYDYQQFWDWLEAVVASCEADTWPECVEKLRRFFGWEYEGMTPP